MVKNFLKSDGKWNSPKWLMLVRISYITGVLLFVWLIMMGLLVVPKPNQASSDVVPKKISRGAWVTAQDGQKSDVIVLLNEQASVIVANQFANRQEKNAYVFDTLYETALDSQNALRDWLNKKGIAHHAFYIVNALQLQADADLLVALSERDDVKRVITNPQISLSTQLAPQTQVSVDRSAIQGVEWGVQRIRAPEVWDMGFRGEGVVVAGQDTGYDWDHPALKQSYRGWDGITVSHDYYWHDAIHSGGGVCGADSTVPCDDHWHGTHTMGTIVGESNDMQIGVAPEARWIGCRNMDQGVGTPSTYAECFEFFIAPYPVVGTPAQGDPSMAPDVINNSWSCPLSEGCDLDHIAFLNQVVDNVRAAGIMVVSSAGNVGGACGTVNQPPAMFDSVYSVGATQSDALDPIAVFSSRGTSTDLLKPDISAPGVGVLSSVPGTGYSTAQGTSMASPHVVGAVALLWSARSDLRGQIQITEDILNQTSVPRYSTQCGDAPQTVPNSVYGWGRVDAYAAVRSGTLSGLVFKLDGEGISGATIKAELQSEVSREISSNTWGSYNLYPISGTYTVTFAKPAYVTQVYTGVVVSVAQTTTLTVTLIYYNVFLPLTLRAP